MAIFTKTTAIWRSLPVRHRGAIIIALPFSCLIITLAILVLSRQNTIKIYEKIDYTRTIILDSNRLLKILLDAETGTRGYIISRNPTFLEPYNEALIQLPVIVSGLEKKIIDNPQKQKFKQLKILANQNINILEQRIQEVELKKQVGIESSQTDILLLRNKNVMDDIRDAIAVFQEDELRKLGLHRQNLDRDSEQ